MSQPQPSWRSAPNTWQPAPSGWQAPTSAPKRVPVGPQRVLQMLAVGLALCSVLAVLASAVTAFHLWHVTRIDPAPDLDYPQGHHAVDAFLVAIIAAGISLLAMFISVGILLARWQRQLRAVGMQFRLASALGFWGWVIPLASYVLPYLFVADLWRATDPLIANTVHANFKNRPVARIVQAWWTLWIGANLLTFGIQASEPAHYIGHPTRLANLFFGVGVLAALVGLSTALLAVILVLLGRRVSYRLEPAGAEAPVSASGSFRAGLVVTIVAALAVADGGAIATRSATGAAARPAATGVNGAPLPSEEPDVPNLTPTEAGAPKPTQYLIKPSGYTSLRPRPIFLPAHFGVSGAARFLRDKRAARLLRKAGFRRGVSDIYRDNRGDVIQIVVFRWSNQTSAFSFAEAAQGRAIRTGRKRVHLGHGVTGYRSSVGGHPDVRAIFAPDLFDTIFLFGNSLNPPVPVRALRHEVARIAVFGDLIL